MFDSRQRLAVQGVGREAVEGIKKVCYLVAMQILGMASGEMRLPMIPLEESKQDGLKQILVDYGLKV